MKLVFTKEALDRLEEIEIFISKDSPLRAEKFVDYLISRAESVSQNLQIGRIVPEISNPDIRGIIVHKYRIVYRLKKNTIEILTVFEGHKLLSLDEINIEL